MKAALVLTAGALMLAGATSAFAQGSPGATAEVRTPGGEMVGTATFTQQSGGVQVRAQLRGLPPGPHGFHLHTTGRCDPPDFMSAGGHFNPTNRQHGLENPEGAHVGDAPNLMVNPDGTATVDMMFDDVTLGSGPTSLFDADGTALMIHAGPDDQMSDPAGNSGSRIACGVVARAAAAPAAQPTPAAKPGAPSQAPAPAAKPAAPAQAPAPAAKPSAPAQAPRPAASPAAAPAQAPRPAALPRTGSALPLAGTAVPAALIGLGAVLGGIAVWRRRR